MRVLLINPNTSNETTERMVRMAREAIDGAAEIIGQTAPYGAFHIRTAEELATAERAVLEIADTHAGNVDAMIISAFADPALEQARAIAGCPVVGIAQASLHTASLYGGGYGIATLVPEMIPGIRKMIEDHGLAGQLVGVRGRDIDGGRTDSRITQTLAGLVTELVEIDHATTVIIAGGPVAGFHHALAGQTDARLLDPVTCATHQAIVLARCL